jgi:hypothetical protein
MQSAAVLTIAQLQVYEKVQNIEQLTAFFLFEASNGIPSARPVVRTDVQSFESSYTHGAPGDADGRTRLAQRVVSTGGEDR